MRMATNLRSRLQQGFTLLEVLVAMVILSTAIVALLGLITTSLNATTRVESATRAAMLGREKMSELLVDGRYSPSGVVNTVGVPPSASGRWDDLTRWEAHYSAGEITAAPGVAVPVPVAIELVVFWKRNRFSAENRLVLETTQLRQMTVAANVR